MAARRKRTIAKGLHWHGHSLMMKVSVNGHSYERALPPDLSVKEAKIERQKFLHEMRGKAGIATGKGTLAHDAARYEKQITHLADWESHRAHLRAWLGEFGSKRRHRIRRADVLEVRGRWIQRGVKPKTCNNRVSALRSLYHALDGDEAPTPCDGVKPLGSHRAPAVSVAPALMLAVEQKLSAREGPYLRSQKTRARFRVLASTGVRPSELMRAEPQDVDLERLVWTVRDGKGGFRPGLYLTDDMLEAWRLFIAAKAWGPFNTGSMARVLRAAGWPAGVRPYNMRHSVGITLSEAGADLSDVQQVLGHKRIETTRRHYVPVLQSRMQRAGQLLAGRLPWPAHESAHETPPDQSRQPASSLEKSRVRHRPGSERKSSRKREKS